MNKIRAQKITFSFTLTSILHNLYENMARLLLFRDKEELYAQNRALGPEDLGRIPKFISKDV